MARRIKKPGVLDIGFSKWTIVHYLNAIIFIIVSYFFFSNPLINFKGFVTNVTLGTMVSFIIFLSIFAYSLGVYKDLKKKTYLKMIAAPLIIIILEVFFTWVSFRNASVLIYYENFLKILVMYLLGAISNFIFFSLYEYTVVSLNDDSIPQEYRNHLS